MSVLILKRGATGDVVRTTPLLTKLNSDVTWITDAKNVVLLQNLRRNVRCVSWEERNSIPDVQWDLVINLEDTLEVALYLARLKYSQLFGAYAGANNSLLYTRDAEPWFDLSIISRHGKLKADNLKLGNRKSYQELVFQGLGFEFEGEEYLLPEPIETGLWGDIAIAAEAGAVWPMKQWAYYNELKRELEGEGLTVNVLPPRNSLLEHLGDVQNHRCLVSGDTLPMHLALGTGNRCVSLFNCTSPWEIYGYGLQRKIVSSLLETFFYKREYDPRATTAISLTDVKAATLSQLGSTDMPSAAPAMTPSA